MPEMDDNKLRKLFQHAGRPPMGNDLSDRIMARVSVTPIHKPLQVKPLIGKAGWFAIVAVFIGLFVLLLNSTGAGTINGTPSLLDPLWQLLPETGGFKISIPNGQWPVWAAAVGALLLLVTLMDRALEKSIRRSDDQMIR